MSATAPKYEQVSTSESGAAPARKPWSSKGNLSKMFVALIVVVGVYGAFTLTHESSVVEDAEREPGYVDTYLSSYPSEQELSFREKVRQALRQDADVAFETLSAGTGKVTPEQWSKIIAALLHSGISDAIHVYSRGGLASLSPIVKGFLDTVSTESKRIDVPLPLTTQRLFDAIDTDADGVIEFAEFVAASRATNLPFMVIAGREPSFSAASAKPVVLELAEGALRLSQQVSEVLYRGVDTQADAVAGLVFGGAESLYFSEVWDILSPFIADKAAEVDAMVQASGQPWGIPDAEVNTAAAEYLAELGAQGQLEGLNEDQFVSFLLRKSLLPAHPWASDPAVLAQIQALDTQLGAVTGVPLSSFVTPLLANLQGAFLNRSFNADSAYHLLTYRLDINRDERVSNAEFNNFIAVFEPLTLSNGHTSTLQRLKTSFSAVCVLMSSAWDEYVDDQGAPDSLWQSDLSMGISNTAELAMKAFNDGVDILRVAVLEPVVTAVVGMAATVLDADSNGAVSVEEFNQGISSAMGGPQ